MLQKVSYIFPIIIEIIHESHNLYDILTLFSLRFLTIAPNKFLTKILLPKFPTNYGFHEAFHKQKQ
jgi:hypothetical protein